MVMLKPTALHAEGSVWQLLCPCLPRQALRTLAAAPGKRCQTRGQGQIQGMSGDYSVLRTQDPWLKRLRRGIQYALKAVRMVTRVLSGINVHPTTLHGPESFRLLSSTGPVVHRKGGHANLHVQTSASTRPGRSGAMKAFMQQTIVNAFDVRPCPASWWSLI